MRITIQQAAMKRGKTLYRIAEDLGIPQRTVYDWQKLNRLPGPEYIDMLCSYLNCEVSEIIKADKFEYCGLTALPDD